MRKVLFATVITIGLAITAYAIVFGLVKLFPPQNSEELGVWAAIVGGAWALYRFGYERRVRSGDVLFELYKDFRDYLPLLGRIEDKNRYRDIEALLERSLKKQIEKQEEWDQLKAIDTMLRHFLLLHCLDANRQIDRETIHVTYRYYALLLMRDERIVMRIYVHRYFATLANFLLDEKIFPDKEEHFEPRKLKPGEVESKVEEFRKGTITAEKLLRELKARAAGKRASQEA